MPCTVPVPKDYAQKYDEGKQSTYGEHQVFTGPYMIENDGKGNDHRLRARQEADPGAQPELGQGRPTSSRRTSTGSSRRAAPTPRSRPGRRSTGQGYLSGDYAAPPVGGAEAGAVVAQGPDLGRAERRQPLHLAQHDGEAARQRERAPCDQRRDRPDGAAADPRRPDARHDRHPLPAAGHRRLRGGGRRGGPGLRLHVEARRRTSRSRSSTCRRRATRTACTTARRC